MVQQVTDQSKKAGGDLHDESKNVTGGGTIDDASRTASGGSVIGDQTAIGGATGGISVSDSGPAVSGSQNVATQTGLVKKVISAPLWSKIAGGLAIAIGLVTTALLILGKTDLVVGGYVIAVAALVVAAIPLFRA